MAHTRKQYRHWDKDMIVAELLSLHRRGVSLTYAGLEEHKNILKLSVRHFGSLRAAVESCGFVYAPARGNTRWTQERVVAGLQELDARGVRMTSAGVRGANSPLFYATREKFGSFSRAIEAAGIVPKERIRRSISAGNERN